MQKTLFALFNITLMCLAGRKLVSLAYELPSWCVCIRSRAYGHEKGGEEKRGGEGRNWGVCSERRMPDIEM